MQLLRSLCGIKCQANGYAQGESDDLCFLPMAWLKINKYTYTSKNKSPPTYL